MIVFTMMVKPENFARYAALIAQEAVSEVSLLVSSVQGFYSDWSPGVSTRAVKVLAPASDDQAVEPQVEGIVPPRLGEVGKSTLTFTRRLVLGKATAPESDD